MVEDLDQSLLGKLARFCAERERCRQDVANRIEKLNSEVDPQPYLDYLAEQDFLNERRYAGAFAHDKFTFNQWGRIKIQFALRRKGIRDRDIDAALIRIESEVYLQTLDKLTAEKLRQTQDEEPLVRKQKVVRYLTQKGYEPELIYARYEENEQPTTR